LKIRSLNDITIVLIILLLSTILLLYVFQFGFVYAQNGDDNNKIDNDFDYIFDPGNYVGSEEEDEEAIDETDNIENIENPNNLIQSSSDQGKEEESSTSSNYNNTNTANNKNNENKLNIIDANNNDNINNNMDTKSLDHVNNNYDSQQENYNIDDKVVVKTRLNLENLEKTGFLNIVAFINGQEVLKNVSLDKLDPTKKSLTVNLAVDKETDIVQAGDRDEFFVCAYHVNDFQKKEFSNALTYFDCDEGDLAALDGSTISRLFSPSSLVYRESQNIFANSTSKYSQLLSTNNGAKSNSNIEKEEKDIVKVKVYSPLEDRKNTQKLKIIAMVKGQIKSVVIDNVQEEFNKIGGYTISRTFTFDRDTNIGKIQIGDKFFACVSSTDLNPPEGTECEKRTIKYIGKENVLYAR
jgi:hypothetical protein